MPRAYSSADARQNKLLAVLPELEWERLWRNLQPVFLPLGSTLYEPRVQLDYAYFPTTAIVSLEHLRPTVRRPKLAPEPVSDAHAKSWPCASSPNGTDFPRNWN